MLKRTLSVGALICVAIGLWSLDARASRGIDVVSDHEAAAVVGGGCDCIQNRPCPGGTDCTGGGLCSGGDCFAKADYVYNSAVCGGNCTGASAANSAGCGP
jgi:hypothetical protein